MSLQIIEAQTGDNPVATILIMHGLGADGRDFVPIAEQLDLSAIGPVRFLFPSAPHLPVTINGGYAMPAWYDIAGPGRPEDEAGLRRSQAAIESLIAREKARGVADARIVRALLAGVMVDPQVLSAVHDALAAKDASNETLREGTQLTLNQLLAALERSKVLAIAPAAGEKFDPHLHQAISMVPAEQEANTVVSVLQKGYTIADRILRPALVTVAAPK